MTKQEYENELITDGLAYVEAEAKAEIARIDTLLKYGNRELLTNYTRRKLEAQLKLHRVKALRDSLEITITGDGDRRNKPIQINAYNRSSE